MMATRDDVTVRIDTELRAKARDLEINMSRLLENALFLEVSRREAMQTVKEGSQEIELNFVDEQDRQYVGRFMGQHVATTRDVEVYVTNDERIVVVDGWNHHIIEDPRDLRAVLADDLDTYVHVMHWIGETPIIDL